MDRYLIIRTSSLGDIVHTLPALAALRRHRPGAGIRWVVGRPGKDILDWVEGLDTIVVAGSSGWRRAIRGENQAALDFQGLMKSGYIAVLSRSKRRIGFHRRNLREKSARIFYNDRATEFPETEHVIRKNLHLLESLGILEDSIDFPLRVPPAARQAVREKITPLGWDGTRRLVLHNVGAAWPTKRWAAARWAEMLKTTASPETVPLLLWGTTEEKRLAEEIAAQSGVTAVPFLTLRESMALIAQAALLVSGDTFALQVACALDIPVVGLFGPTNPRRNGPFRARDRVAYHEIKCSRCYARSCRSLACMDAISSAEVAGLVRGALNEHA